MAMFPYVPQHQIITSTESPRCCYYAAQRSLAAPGPGVLSVDDAKSVVIGESLRTPPSYCELLRQDMSTCFLVIVVWCCFPCSWTKFNVGLGVWLMSAGKPIGTRSAGRWIVGWVKPSSAGICFGNSCYLELDSIHQAILCFMPSLSTKLCILFIGSVNVPTLPCSHGNLDIQQSQSDLQDSWRQCASSADCFVTILCPSEHFNHLDWEWMCDVCVCTLQGSNDNN